MHANVVTTTFRTPADLEAASAELRSIVSKIDQVPGLVAYFLIQIGVRQVISLGIYESEDAAKQALDALTPVFAPIVTPRVDSSPDFGGGAILAAVLNRSG